MAARRGPFQPGLFDEPEGPSAASRLALEHAEAARIAARLPPEVRFGTSSWSFPGWAGIVWSEERSATWLAREGLAEYARHPLLTTVGIDRGYYAPIPEADLARYADQLPPGFPCCAKAPEAVTSVALPAVAGARRQPNPDFLSAGRFTTEMVEPFLRCFRQHTGPFVIQLPPAPEVLRPDPGAFAANLASFLQALPREARYAVELRDPRLLTPAYRDALAASGAAHVYNYASAMPTLAEQAARVPPGQAPFLMVRLLMRRGSRYADRKEAFAPFDRIQDADGQMRAEVTALVDGAADGGRPAFLLVNNKAEGSAPLTIKALAELVGRDP